MSDQTSYKMDGHGTPAKFLSEHESSDGRRWVVYEAPTKVDSISKTSWDEMARSTAAAFSVAQAKVRAAVERAALVARHGVVVATRSGYFRLDNKSTAVIVRTTKTQLIAENGDRYNRETGTCRVVGSYTRRIEADDLARVEQLSGGRERVDFIAEGQARESEA